MPYHSAHRPGKLDSSSLILLALAFALLSHQGLANPLPFSAQSGFLPAAISFAAFLKPENMARKCEKGDADQCLAAGNSYYYGKGVTADLDKAVELYTTGCRIDQRESCKQLYSIGKSFRDGENAQADIDRALSLFKTACAGGKRGTRNSASACAAAGRIIHPEPVALAYFERGCDTGSYDACRLLGDSFFEGKLTSKNVPKAIEAFDKACTGGRKQNRACRAVGLIYLRGDDVEKDSAKAGNYFKLGCEKGNGDGRACSEYALLMDTGVMPISDSDSVLNAYRNACRMADNPWPAACTSLATLYNQGRGVPRDLDQTRSYYDYGCRGKDPDACRLRCEMACDDGQHWGCSAVQSKQYPSGVAGCLADQRDVVSPDMNKLMQDYLKNNPEQAEAIRKQMESLESDG